MEFLGCAGSSWGKALGGGAKGKMGIIFFILVCLSYLSVEATQ